MGSLTDILVRGFKLLILLGSLTDLRLRGWLQILVELLLLDTGLTTESRSPLRDSRLGFRVVVHSDKEVFTCQRCLSGEVLVSMQLTGLYKDLAIAISV